MRYLVIALSLVLSPGAAARAQVSIEFSIPSIRIGFSQPVYPRLVAVPGYPVYYDPDSTSNYFFYDGLYWVYEGDEWYASSWYDGPWGRVDYDLVPLFVLRVPVSYYRRPPASFRGWRSDAPPRWGERWGRDWERQHDGWDRWDRRQVPAPAPLPTYQRQFSGDRYPQQPRQQQALRAQHDRHEPRDPAVKQVLRAHDQQGGAAAVPPGNRGEPAPRGRPPQAVEPAHHPAPQAEPSHVGTSRPESTRAAPQAEPARDAPHAQAARAPEKHEEKRQEGAPAHERGAPASRRDQEQKRGEERDQEHGR